MTNPISQDREGEKVSGDPHSRDEVSPAAAPSPTCDPANAAARLAALLARPLEPAARPFDPVHREAAIVRPSAWTRPAAERMEAAPQLKPESEPVPTAEPPVPHIEAPEHPIGTPASPAEAEAPTAEAAAPATEAELASVEPHENATDKKAADTDATDLISEAMAKLVKDIVAARSAGRREPAHELAGRGCDTGKPAAPAPIAPVESQPADDAARLDESSPPPPIAPRSDGEPPLNPAAARIVGRVRRLMLISTLTTVIGVGAIFGVIGYRIYKSAATVPPSPVVLAPTPGAPPASTFPTEQTVTLPKNAKVIQTVVAEGRLVITLDIAGMIEIRTFDLKTLQPLGRLTFTEVQ